MKSATGNPSRPFGSESLRSKILEEIIQRCEELSEDVTFRSVRHWKEEHPGSRAIGCFPVYTPGEIVHAAGMLPVGVVGGGNKIDIDHADSRVQSFVCSIARSTLELGLVKHLDCLDGMIFPSICDVSKNLSGLWKRNFPEKFVQYLHLPQNVTSKHSTAYLFSEFDSLKKNLEALRGFPISQEELARSVHAYNENRTLLSRLYDLKRERPWQASMLEIYVLVKAGTVLPKEEHSLLLKQALPLLEKRENRPKDRIRVMIEGSFCEQPPLELLEVLEEAGCYIVEDDFLLGLKFFEDPIPDDGDLLWNLAASYLTWSRYSSIKHYGEKPRVTAFLEKLREARVDGVIFSAAKFCEPALFDYVLLKQALEKEKIPYLSFEFEEKMTTFEAVRSQVETFVESILFFS